jgi:tRNA-specific adenosine deaminase 3
MRHLKRGRRPRDDAGEHTYIALSMADEAGPTADELASSLEEFNPVLAALAPIVVAVPKHAAKTPEQLKARGALWPVTFSPQAPRPGDARAFTPAKLAWVREGIARVLADAAVAKAAGELPVAVFCTSPPEALWPHDPNSVAFIPPTPGLRAAGHDSRTSEAHPLRHAAFNCIARIARLRTVPPFSEVQSKVNGADYLLTSMSLFTTHEPCTMCAMALLHSRVREVFYVHARPRSGGLESSFGVHSTKVLNHRFEAWKWCGEVPADEVDGSVEI